ncbi:MAG: hypothetical protein AABW72_03160 [archaeon]
MTPEFLEMFKEAGIIPNANFVNIGFVRGRTPVFFEVAYIDLNKAENFAARIKDHALRDQAIAILTSLRKTIPIDRQGKLVNVPDVE